MNLPIATLGPLMSRLPFWRQLRWNLVLVFVLLTAIPLVTVQYITLRQTADQAQKQVFNQLQSVSNLKTNELTQLLGAGHSHLFAVLDPNTLDVINSVISGPTDAQTQTQLNSILTNLASVASIDANQAHKLFNDVFLYGSAGTVLAASTPVDIGKVVTHQPFYSASLLDSYTQPPFYEVGSGQLTIVLTEPVKVQGKMIGVLAGTINISALVTIMTERIGLGETGETYLVSSDNNYLLTPSRFEGYSQTRAFHSDGIDKALSGQTGSARYLNYRDRSVLGYYSWLPELQVGLLAEQDETEALAAVQGVLTSSVLIAALSVLIAFTFGFWLVTQISGPVRDLAQAAMTIARGNLSTRVQVRQRNEIGLLGTAFNQMTEQLAKNIQQLDRQVEEINRTNQELQIASAQAREAARVKSEFMATMSHELRTPLNAMLGFSGILIEGMGGEVDDEARHMVTRIYSNSERLLNLINGVLDIAKIEAGRLEIVEHPVNLRQLVDSWQGQMGVLAEQKHLLFEVEVDPSLPLLIKTDAERLSQIVINLLSNAFKFTETGRVKLSVQPGDSQLQIEVSDTGIGIPSHALNYIFEEFRQLDGSSRRAYGGTGLGLAIVRNLCRMMNGSVRVRSELGKGSAFTVTLPLYPVQATVLSLQGNLA